MALLVVNQRPVHLPHVNLPLKTTHQQPLGGDLGAVEGTASHDTITGYKTMMGCFVAKTVMAELL